MTQTIRVEAVLREAVRTPYCDLVTRSTGRAVRTSIQQALESRPVALALLDFSQVGLVDFSCADEVVAKLLLDAPPDTTIVLQGLREEHLEAIEHVLEHHDLAALVRDPVSGTARMVGRVSPDLSAAFLALQREGTATAEVLARLTGWPADQTEAVLRALLRLRLVRLSGARYIAPFSDDAPAWP